MVAETGACHSLAEWVRQLTRARRVACQPADRKALGRRRLMTGQIRIGSRTLDSDLVGGEEL